MTPVPINHSYEQDYIPAVIGASVCVLNGDYNPDQLWMEFMAGSVIKLPRREEHPRPARPWSPFRNNSTTLKISEYARQPTGEHKNLYNYRLNVPQGVLPFHEHRNATKGEYARLMKAEFPDWDRDHTNPWHRFEGSERTRGMICIPFANGLKDEVKAWCEENCTGRYSVKTRYVILQRLVDAPMCKMLWWQETRKK